MPHIIRLEAGDGAPMARLEVYGYIGPFDSFELAGKWLNEKKFTQVRPNLWERYGTSTLNYYGVKACRVGNLRALVHATRTVEELDFIPL